MLNVLFVYVVLALYFDVLSYILFISGFPRRQAQSNTENNYLLPSIKCLRGRLLVGQPWFSARRVTLARGTTPSFVPTSIGDAIQHWLGALPQGTAQTPQAQLPVLGDLGGEQLGAPAPSTEVSMESGPLHLLSALCGVSGPCACWTSKSQLQATAPTMGPISEGEASRAPRETWVRPPHLLLLPQLLPSQWNSPGALTHLRPGLCA